MNKKLILFMTTLWMAFNSYSRVNPNIENSVKEVVLLYKKGAYPQAIEKITPLTKNKKTKAIAWYWKGLCEAKLQNYDEANIAYGKAYGNKVQAKDFYYEYGQSLYAANELKKARKFFVKSAKKNFKAPTSLYYLAYISQLLEEYPIAIKYFKRIANRLKNKTDINQAANLQLAEIYLTQAERKSDPLKTVKNIVLPQFDRAYEVASTSTIAPSILKRISEVKDKYDLDDSKLRNGRKLNSKRYRIRFAQSFAYDDNVTNEGDEANIKATDKASAIFNTTLQGSYLFTHNRRFTHKPEVKITKKKHHEDNNGSVYTNDQDTINASIDNTYDATLWKKQLTTNYNLEFTETNQDWDQDKQPEFYSRTFTHTLGEKIKFLDKYFSFLSSTTFKLKYKVLESYDPAKKSDTKGWSITQTMLFPKGMIGVLTINRDATDVERTPTSSTTTTLFRFDYILPKTIWDIKLSSSFSFTALDTELNQNTRGTEKTYKPSIKVERKFLKIIDASLEYAYTKNTSKDKITYAYSKNEVTLLGEIDF